METVRASKYWGGEASTKLTCGLKDRVIEVDNKWAFKTARKKSPAALIIWRLE